MDSLLARSTTVALDCTVSEEACPLDLAPTSSSTAALAMGDALAMVLLQRKGFRAEDFARIHPAGSLGRRLTLRVGDLMVKEDYPELGRTPSCGTVSYPSRTCGVRYRSWI
jgi:arabinose-5-phosphate isomerase